MSGLLSERSRPLDQRREDELFRKRERLIQQGRGLSSVVAPTPLHEQGGPLVERPSRLDDTAARPAPRDRLLEVRVGHVEAVETRRQEPEDAVHAGLAPRTNVPRCASRA
jgi:hypothetical protein